MSDFRNCRAWAVVRCLTHRQGFSRDGMYEWCMVLPHPKAPCYMRWLSNWTDTSCMTTSTLRKQTLDNWEVTTARDMQMCKEAQKASYFFIKEKWCYTQVSCVCVTIHTYSMWVDEWRQTCTHKNTHKRQCQLWRVCTSNHKPQNTHTYTHTLNTLWLTYTQFVQLYFTQWHHHGMLRAVDFGSRPKCCSLLGNSG